MDACFAIALQLKAALSQEILSDASENELKKLKRLWGFLDSYSSLEASRTGTEKRMELPSIDLLLRSLCFHVDSFPSFIPGYKDSVNFLKMRRMSEILQPFLHCKASTISPSQQNSQIMKYLLFFDSPTKSMLAPIPTTPSSANMYEEAMKLSKGQATSPPTSPYKPPKLSGDKIPDSYHDSLKKTPLKPPALEMVRNSGTRTRQSSVSVAGAKAQRYSDTPSLTSSLGSHSKRDSLSNLTITNIEQRPGSQPILTVDQESRKSSPQFSERRPSTSSGGNKKEENWDDDFGSLSQSIEIKRPSTHSKSPSSREDDNQDSSGRKTPLHRISGEDWDGDFDSVPQLASRSSPQLMIKTTPKSPEKPKQPCSKLQQEQDNWNEDFDLPKEQSTMKTPKLASMEEPPSSSPRLVVKIPRTFDKKLSENTPPNNKPANDDNWDDDFGVATSPSQKNPILTPTHENNDNNWDSDFCSEVPSIVVTKPKLNQPLTPTETTTMKGNNINAPERWDDDFSGPSIPSSLSLSSSAPSHSRKGKHIRANSEAINSRPKDK
eukprot:TRINITY_DN1545_c0_g2_i1.p1 TRINITY_DN1545_c0_g2~~TRINITY_DN1545_c0_g2_i1.p1  ORF type:complete len:549 (+),score=151.20 TRINITY_DN1545_c0_g2_i1:585-2231(+)